MNFFRSTWAGIVGAAIVFVGLLVYLALGPGNHCAQGSLCFEIAKGFPAAFVALVIGGIAGCIAWRQYQLAREQHEVTRAKLKLDLFEKRYDIFEKTWSFLSRMQQTGPGTNPHDDFTNVIPQASFLFGKDVEDYLNEATTNRIELWAIDARTSSNNSVMRKEDIERYEVLMGWFHQQASTGVKKVFAPYLDFEKWR